MSGRHAAAFRAGVAPKTQYRCAVTSRFVSLGVIVKAPARSRAGAEPRRVVVVGDTVISEQGLVAIFGRDSRYRVCGGADTFGEANELVPVQLEPPKQKQKNET